MIACQQSQESSDSSENATLTSTFNGKTKTYTDASISEGELSSIGRIGIKAGSTGDDSFSLTAFGYQQA